MDPFQGEGTSLVTFSIALFLAELCLILEGIFSPLLITQDWGGQHLVELIFISDQIDEL